MAASSVPAVPTTGSATGSARRDVLLEELVALFLEEGFLASSVDDLAARLRCSKSTLYAIAPSREQLVTTVVRAFFRGATARVDAALEETGDDAVARLETYLRAISAELAAGSPRFFRDLDAFAPAREVYSANTGFAADRVAGLVNAVGGSAVPPEFLGAVARLVMEGIRRGDLAGAGLTDATAYEALATLVVAATGHR